MPDGMKDYYTFRGEVYAVLGVCRLIVDGEGMPGVVYLQDGKMFTRSRVDFNRIFKACDIEGNLIGDHYAVGEGPTQ